MLSLFAPRSRIFKCILLSSLLLVFVIPTSAQFGLGPKRKKEPTEFEKLQERAASRGGRNDDSQDDMEAHLRAMLGGGDNANDPEIQKYLEQIGSQFGNAMEQLAKMSPEDLEKQMSEAMKMLTEDSMVNNVLDQRDEILKTLETAGSVPPEELAKFKADPEYFELKMRESFEQMKGMFSDPEMMKSMAEAMSGMSELFGAQNELMGDLQKLASSGDLSDDKIEEARLTLLQSDHADNPLLAEMMKSDEMVDLLRDPVAWKKSVKEGLKGMGGGFLDPAKLEL